MNTPITLGLVGNPNCGKSTLFNALTGAKQRVGNWPGVTVERRSGITYAGDQPIEVIDLPGVYSLSTFSGASAIDERIACDAIYSRQADLIINIVDATNLERNLYLTSQLLEMSVPVIVAVNMMDVARRQHLSIDLDALSARLRCPVVGLVSHKAKGIAVLKKHILALAADPKPTQGFVLYPAPIQAAREQLASAIDQPDPAWLALRLLDDDEYAKQQITTDIVALAQEQQQAIAQQIEEDPDILIAEARYVAIQDIVRAVITKKPSVQRTLTDHLDRVFLHRFLGIPIFLAIMYFMFMFSINFAGIFQDFFDIGSEAIFVHGLAHLLTHWGVSNWLVAILAAGIGKGINTTLTFIPIIAGMFFFLAFLEGSGYMARAAFVMDRLMRAIGLPGKAFVPMIVGFGCNVPAIMGARTLEHKRDRVLTVMMTPFMSCSARLAIYAVFVTAFFPKGGQNVVFVLYLTGILIAILTGLILRKTLLTGDPSPLVMELPLYHLPTPRALCIQMWDRLKSFIFRAGKMIIPVCLLIGALNSINLNGTVNLDGTNQHSLLAEIGRTVTPVFRPMGITQDNWPATVGLVTGVLAKEVVVATLNTLYTQAGHLHGQHEATLTVRQSLQAAVSSVKDNFLSLSDSLGNPVLASMPEHRVSHGVYGEMYHRFGHQASAFAYLLFVLLYFPCISAVAAMARELSWRWAMFAMLWNSMVAYSAAVLFYQGVIFFTHPLVSILWWSGIGGSLSLLFMGLRYYGLKAVETTPAHAASHQSL